MIVELSSKWKEIENPESIILAPAIVGGTRKYRVFYKDVIEFPTLEVFDFVAISRGSNTFNYAVVVAVNRDSHAFNYSVRTQFYTAVLEPNGHVSWCSRNDYVGAKAISVSRNGENIWERASDEEE